MLEHDTYKTFMLNICNGYDLAQFYKCKFWRRSDVTIFTFSNSFESHQLQKSFIECKTAFHLLNWCKDKLLNEEGKVIVDRNPRLLSQRLISRYPFFAILISRIQERPTIALFFCVMLKIYLLMWNEMFAPMELFVKKKVDISFTSNRWSFIYTVRPCLVWRSGLSFARQSQICSNWFSVSKFRLRFLTG